MSCSSAAVNTPSGSRKSSSVHVVPRARCAALSAALGCTQRRARRIQSSQSATYQYGTPQTRQHSAHAEPHGRTMTSDFRWEYLPPRSCRTSPSESVDLGTAYCFSCTRSLLFMNRRTYRVASVDCWRASCVGVASSGLTSQETSLWVPGPPGSLRCAGRDSWAKRRSKFARPRSAALALGRMRIAFPRPPLLPRAAQLRGRSARSMAAEARAQPWWDAQHFTATRWWDETTVAVVTGANKGIGAEIARQLAAQGIAVVATSRDKRRGADAAAALSADVQRPVAFHQARLQLLCVLCSAAETRLQLDVTDADSVAAFADWVQRTYPQGVSILVNNAGIAYKACGVLRLSHHSSDFCQTDNRVILSAPQRHATRFPPTCTAPWQ